VARIFNLAENFWLLQTAGGTLITVPFIWVVARYLTRKFRTRKRDWRVDTDDDFKLKRSRQSPLQSASRARSRPRLRPGAGNQKPSIFIFPGRELCHG
jgi:hypothetical protein